MKKHIHSFLLVSILTSIVCIIFFQQYQISSIYTLHQQLQEKTSSLTYLQNKLLEFNNDSTVKNSPTNNRGIPAKIITISNNNAINTIKPFWRNGTWMFNDSSTGLINEPFVAGIPKMISILTTNIAHAKDGFRLLFSAQKFPDYDMSLLWQKEENGGNWYLAKDYNVTGWICPAMFHYFKTTPNEIFIKAEAI